MKANELMVGDWVAYRRDFPDKVDAIAIGGLSVHLEKDGWLRVDDIQPVCLTPKILEKNGFSQDPLNGHIFVFDKNSGEVIYYEFGPKYGLTIDNQSATIQDLKIKHIHELQHALRLCRIDKEIEL